MDLLSFGLFILLWDFYSWLQQKQNLDSRELWWPIPALHTTFQLFKYLIFHCIQVFSNTMFTTTFKVFWSVLSFFSPLQLIYLDFFFSFPFVWHLFWFLCFCTLSSAEQSLLIIATVLFYFWFTLPSFPSSIILLLVSWYGTGIGFVWQLWTMKLFQRHMYGMWNWHLSRTDNVEACGERYSCHKSYVQFFSSWKKASKASREES